MNHTVSARVRRTTSGIIAGLAGAALSVACAQPAAPSAVAAATTGVTSLQSGSPNFTPADLVARGWTCMPTPTPNRIVCSPPNQGFPVFSVPPPEDRPASYSLWMFDSGNFTGPYTLLRSDLYQGQPCDGTGLPWINRAAVGYYECVHKVGR